MLGWIYGGSNDARVKRQIGRTILKFDRLEDRTVPVISTLDVNSLLDTPDAVAGDGKWEDAQGNKTLRAAIDYANEANNIRTGNYNVNRYDIVFLGAAAPVAVVVGGPGPVVPPPPPPTITLGSSLVPKSNLNVIGYPSLTIQRDPDNPGQFRLFDFSAGTESRLFSLTLAHGQFGVDGGAILNQDKLHIENCNFHDNRSNTKGGAIACFGDASLFVTNSSFWYNSAQFGGAISAERASQISIVDSDIFSNEAFSVGMTPGQGGGLYLNTDTATAVPALTNTRIYGNSATGAGGGVFVSDTAFSMTGGEIHGNTAGFSGGGIYVDATNKTITLTNLKLTNNQTGGKGGGAYISNGSLNGSLSIFTGNAATGGINGIGYKKNDALAPIVVPAGQQTKEEDP